MATAAPEVEGTRAGVEEMSEGARNGDPAMGFRGQGYAGDISNAPGQSQMQENVEDLAENFTNANLQDSTEHQKEASKTEEESDEEDFHFDPSIFLPKPDDAVLVDFDFLGKKVELFVQKANATAFDMTGVIVWPVSQLLAWYLVAHQELVQGQNVVEIGAGCGLVSFTAAQLQPASVCITDGEDIVCEMLRRSAKHAEENAPVDSPPIHVQKLLWGDDNESLDELVKSSAFQPTSVVVGADVFHPSFGNPEEVFELVEALASRTQGGAGEVKFICGFVDRCNQPSVFKAAEICGFTMESEDPDSFLPSHLRAADLSQRQLQLLRFSKNLPASSA